MGHNYLAVFKLLDSQKKRIDKETFIGFYISIAMNKQVFASNNEAGFFLNDTLNILLPNYVMKSRTLMVARACRILLSADEIAFEKFIKNTLVYLSKFDEGISLPTNKSIKTTNIKGNSSSNMKKWIEGILKKDN